MSDPHPEYPLARGPDAGFPSPDPASGAVVLVADAPVRSVQPTDDLLARVRAHAFDPTVFDEQQPFVWRALISNQRVDSYGTTMMPSSLRNYAADAEAGVSYQNSHQRFELPLGRSFAGTYRDGRAAGGKHAEADFYTVPGLQLGRVNTNDLIAGMRAGILHDVSIGFVPGQIRCSICGQDMLDYGAGCTHVPLLSYQTKDEKGRATGDMQMCVGEVHDAHLTEVSQVYDGATPGAAVLGILQATRLIAEGAIRQDAVDLIQTRYRVHLPSVPTRFAGAHVPAADQPHDAEEAPMPPTPADTDTRAPAEPDALDGIRALLRQHGVPQPDLPEAAIRGLLAELPDLRARAADGRKARELLLDEALREGVRADGEKFPRERYALLLADADMETVAQFRDDWRARADEHLTTSDAERRHLTEDTAGAGPPEKPGRRTSTAAYRA